MYPPVQIKKAKSNLCYLLFSAALQKGLCQGAEKWQFLLFQSKHGQKIFFSGVWDFVLRNLRYKYFRKSGLALEIMADNVFVRCPLNLWWQAVQSKTLISPWKHAQTWVVGEKGKLNHSCGRRPSITNLSISNILFRCWFEYWRKAFQSTFPLLGNACTWKVSTQ